jgi:hypothetical protein
MSGELFSNRSMGGTFSSPDTLRRRLQHRSGGGGSAFRICAASSTDFKRGRVRNDFTAAVDFQETCMATISRKRPIDRATTSLNHTKSVLGGQI